MAARTLQRKKAHREWLLRNLTTSVILYERVQTTEAKAKEARRWVDKMINLAKEDTLTARRQMLGWFPDRQAVKKIWEVLRERYQDRTSGYARLMHAGRRHGDNAPLVLIELLPAPVATPTPQSADAPVDEKTRPAQKKLQLRKPKATVTIRRKGRKE